MSAFRSAIAILCLLCACVVSLQAQRKRHIPLRYKPYRLELTIVDKEGKAWVDDFLGFNFDNPGKLYKALWTYDNLSVEDVLLDRGPSYLANVWEYQFDAFAKDYLTIKICSKSGYGEAKVLVPTKNTAPLKGTVRLQEQECPDDEDFVWPSPTIRIRWAK